MNLRQFLLSGRFRSSMTWKSWLLFFGVFTVACAICGLLRTVSTSDVHVPLIFVLAVLVIALWTDGYFYGIAAALVSVVTVNYAFIHLRMFLDLRMLRKTNYAVTDRRIIAQSDRVLSVALDRIREAVIRTDDEGRATLLCGRKAVSMPPRKWRVAAIVENSAEGDGAKGECPSFVLYAPGDMEGLRKALGDRIPLRSA